MTPQPPDLSAVTEALALIDGGMGAYDELTPTLETVLAAARAYLRLLSEGQTYETEDCVHEHPGHSSLEVFDLDPGSCLVAPMSAIGETGGS